MFDYLFTVMGPVGSSAALAMILLTIAVVVSIARMVGPRRIAGPRF